MGASLALISLTPWSDQFWRYLAPTCPFLAIGFTVSLWRAKETLEGHIGSRTCALATVLLAASFLLAQVLALRSMFSRSWSESVLLGRSGAVAGRAFFLEKEWNAFHAAMVWLGANTAPSEVVASSSPQLVYLGTNRKAVMPPLEPDPEAAQAALDSVPVTYLLVDDLSFSSVARRYVRPLAETRPDLWEPVFQAGGESQLGIWKRR